MARPIITLTTDFGTGSPYVAAVKGVILSIAPDVTLIDITHAVGPQDIRQAALVLAEVCDRFPDGTIHVAVVDPGVGSERRIIYAEIGRQRFVAPDNGLLSGLARRTMPSTIRTLTEPDLWLPEVSATFHGRDIMGPVAARLALGLPPERLGPIQEQLVELTWPEVRVTAGRIEGVVQSIDSFGNLVTNITDAALADAPRDERVTVTCDEHETMGIWRAYSDQPEMTLIALVGSSGHLEIAIVGDSAAIMLGVKVGMPVVVKWG